MSVAPCPYCDKIPEIQQRNPVAGAREIYLVCEECGLEIGGMKRVRVFREWEDNYNEVKRYEAEMI